MKSQEIPPFPINYHEPERIYLLIDVWILKKDKIIRVNLDDTTTVNDEFLQPHEVDCITIYMEGNFKLQVLKNLQEVRQTLIKELCTQSK